MEVDDPQDLDDVSKCHMLLLPSHGDSKTSGQGTPYRLLTFGRKHLPASRDEGAHEVEWGRITAVGDDLKELKDALGPSTYETKVSLLLHLLDRRLHGSESSTTESALLRHTALHYT